MASPPLQHLLADRSGGKSSCAIAGSIPLSGSRRTTCSTPISSVTEWKGCSPWSTLSSAGSGMLACGEILVPESSRVLMLRGAEVLLHPTNEPYTRRGGGQDRGGRRQHDVCGQRQCGRADRLLGRRSGGKVGASRPRRELADRQLQRRDALPPGEPRGVRSRFLGARHRGPARRPPRPDDGNQILRTRFEVFRPFYDGTQFWPANEFLAEPMAHFTATERVAAQAVGNLIRLGVAVRPGGAGAST